MTRREECHAVIATDRQEGRPGACATGRCVTRRTVKTETSYKMALEII